MTRRGRPSSDSVLDLKRKRTQMKNIKTLIALAALPFCSNLASFGQDAAPPPPAPGVPAPPGAARNGPPPGAIPRPPTAPAGIGGGMMGGGTAAPYPAPGSPGSFTERLNRIIRSASFSGAATPMSPLVIRSSALDPKAQANLQEDLAVMAHILEKALEEGARSARAMGIELIGSPETGGPRSVYIEGYGALFTMSIGFPLLAPPPRAEDRNEQPAADSTWEEAKRELHGQAAMPGIPGAMPMPPAVEEYSAEKVNKTKDAVVQALKNATNIRGMKPEDWVTVCVLGGPAGPGRAGQAGGFNTGGGGGGYGGGYVSVNAPPGAAAPNPSVMTIRVKKADVDAFAKGQMNADEFRKQARIETYGAGGGGGGVGGMER